MEELVKKQEDMLCFLCGRNYISRKNGYLFEVNCYCGSDDNDDSFDYNSFQYSIFWFYYGKLQELSFRSFKCKDFSVNINFDSGMTYIYKNAAIDAQIKIKGLNIINFDDLDNLDSQIKNIELLF